MKLLINLLLIISLTFQVSLAQNYSQYAEAVSSGGGSSNNGSYQNFSVIGEAIVNKNVEDAASTFNTDIGYIYMTRMHDTTTNVDPIIQDQKFLDYLRVYPNPTSGKISIALKPKKAKKLSVQIQNTVGKIIYEASWQLALSKYQKTISLKEHAAGVYFLQLKTDNGIVNRKIVVE